MPIAINVNRFPGQTKGEGRAAPTPDGGAGAASTRGAGVLPAVVAAAVKPATVAVAAPTLTTATAALRPEVMVARPPVALRPEIVAALMAKTATQIARGAIKQLQEASANVLDEAIKTIKNRNISAGGLMNYLERKVKIGEVLNELARDWEDETKQDFAEAFNMAANKLQVMDCVVSIAVLNDPDLDEELMAENLPEASETDLVENRRITWQYPAAGTLMRTPCVILVAVEHRDVAQAEEVLDSILGQLTSYQGFKLPKATVTKLKRQAARG